MAKIQMVCPFSLKPIFNLTKKISTSSSGYVEQHDGCCNYNSGYVEQHDGCCNYNSGYVEQHDGCCNYNSGYVEQHSPEVSG